MMPLHCMGTHEILVSPIEVRAYQKNKETHTGQAHKQAQATCNGLCTDTKARESKIGKTKLLDKTMGAIKC